MKISNGDDDLQPEFNSAAAPARIYCDASKSRDRPHTKMQDCVTMTSLRPNGFRTTGEDDFVVDDLRYLQFITLSSCLSAIPFADDSHSVW